MNKVESQPHMENLPPIEAAQSFEREVTGKFHTVLADPPYAKKVIMQSSPINIIYFQ